MGSRFLVSALNFYFSYLYIGTPICYVFAIRRYATYFDAMLKWFSPWYVNVFFFGVYKCFFVLVFYLETEEGGVVLCVCER